MKHFPLFLLATSALLTTGTAFAAKNKCEYSKNTTDFDTGEVIVQTEWDALITIIMSNETDTYGSVSVISVDGQKFLSIKLTAMDYHPLPGEFTGLEDPTWYPAHREFLDSLLGDAVIFPVGSSIRLDLDDQTSLTLHTIEHQRLRTHYTKPGGDPKARDSQQKTAKKLIGFLASAAGGDVETESSPHYMINVNVFLEYPIDAESEAILRRAAVTSARIESRDKYYQMGWRSTKDQVFSWNKKSYYKIKDALQCIDLATGQGES